MLSFIFILLCLIQLVYGLVFFFGFLTQSWEENQEPIDLTVLICARNAEAQLQKNIPLILDNLLPNQELIVVDDKSTDGSIPYLQSLGHPKLRVIKNTDKQGKKYAQKLGVEQASNEHILVTDADCAPLSPSWTRAVAYSIQRPLTLLYAPYRRGRGLLGFMVQSETLMTAMQYLSYAQFGVPYMGVGRNLAFSKSAYLDSLTEDFYALPYGDDDLFVSSYATRANTTVNYHSDTWTLSDAPSTWREWYTQKSRHTSTSKKYRWSQKIELALFPLSLLGFYISAYALLGGTWGTVAVAARWLLFLFFYSQACRRLAYSDYWFGMPVVELVWLFYLTLVSPFIFILNKKSW